jgi:hypothetical protein
MFFAYKNESVNLSSNESFERYRAVRSGKWSDVTIWEKYDHGNWIPSCVSPSGNNKSVLIADNTFVSLDYEIFVGGIFLGKNSKLDTSKVTIRSI